MQIIKYKGVQITLWQENRALDPDDTDIKWAARAMVHKPGDVRFFADSPVVAEIGAKAQIDLMLLAQGLTPTSPDWENTEIAFLCRD